MVAVIDHSSGLGSVSLFEPLLALVPEMGSYVKIYKITFSDRDHAAVVAQIYPHALQVIS